MRARRDAAEFLRRLWRLEAALVEAGFPAMSEWWRDTLARFYLSGKLRLTIRKGRRVGASTLIAPRLGCAEMLFGQHQHLPGTPPNMFVFLSVKRGEAAKRLRGITAILDVLGEPYTQSGDTIELHSRPAIFAVMTANFRTNVGDTVAFAWCDEVARWRDDAAMANPAEEVIGSLSPALATLPDAKLFLVSSPLGQRDYHARAFDRGETSDQCVAFGATWEINPSLSEEYTRRLEPDARIWLREYGGVPQAAQTAAFDADAVERAFIWPAELGIAHRRVLVIDASSGKKDTWSHARCGWNQWGNTRRLVFDAVDGFEGSFWKQLTGDELVRRVAVAAKAAGIAVVHGDQRESLMLSSAFRRHGVRFVEHAWTAPKKEQAVATVRRWLTDDMLVLPEHEKLRAEMLAFEERVTQSGGLTFGARGSGHDDYVALLLTAAMADARGMLNGSTRCAGTTTYGTMREAFRGNSRRDTTSFQQAAEEHPWQTSPTVRTG